MTRGNRIRSRDAWEWELQSVLASEEAARVLKHDPEQAARWSRLAIMALEAARLKRLDEKKHSPEGNT